LNFDAEYLPYTLKAGIITGIIALAVSSLNFFYSFTKTEYYYKSRAN
jgi:hypothetical protein